MFFPVSLVLLCSPGNVLALRRPVPDYSTILGGAAPPIFSTMHVDLEKKWSDRIKRHRGRIDPQTGLPLPAPGEDPYDDGLTLHPALTLDQLSRAAADKPVAEVGGKPPWRARRAVNLAHTFESSKRFPNFRSIPVMADWSEVEEEYAGATDPEEKEAISNQMIFMGI